MIQSPHFQINQMHQVNIDSIIITKFKNFFLLEQITDNSSLIKHW